MTPQARRRSRSGVVSPKFAAYTLTERTKANQQPSEHPNQQRYGGQRIFVVQRDDYVYVVPFVEDEKLIFLKTIIPSRKATKQYLGEEPEDHEA